MTDTTVSTVHSAHEQAVAAALAALDLETKVSLLAGQDWWTLPAVPAIGLDSLVMSDGPVGVRGVERDPNDPAVALPSPTALAATWDVELARTAGRLLGQESRRKGVHMLLAPTVNLHRSPRGGRHFECYSEDPLLTAEIGAGYVKGVQDQGVAATVKHYVANDSETERFTVDVQVSERALRELYLLPFETIVTRAGVWAVMAAYNSVNGFTMTEHSGLMRGVLKQEWAFDGAVVSDWTAARSTIQAPLGGLDIAMPAANNPWGDRLVSAVRSGAVPVEVIDEMVRRVLRLAARVGAFRDVPPAVAPQDRPAALSGPAVAREIAARSFVLARNVGDLLPLDPARLGSIAVIGAAAKDARVLGGGSAIVYPDHVVSPLAGLTDALPSTVELTYARGADPRTKLPAAEGPQWSDLLATLRGPDGQVLQGIELPNGAARWRDRLPGGLRVDQLGSVEITGTLTPALDGAHQLGIQGLGEFRLTVDGQTIFDGALLPDFDDPGSGVLGVREERVEVPLRAGQPVRVSLTQRAALTPHSLTPYVFFALAHGDPSATEELMLEEAVAAAAAAQVAVVVVATTAEVESEGFDRESLSLPGRQDELVSRVAAVNPRTVVVVNAGSPVLMPWLDDVAAVLLTWFPGQEAGAALADVLLGAAEPSGRLPTTWPRRLEDCPVWHTVPKGGALPYDEGVFIGYRAWQRAGTQPLFPFGHGLGYTTWSYQELRVEPGPGLGTARVVLRNTGDRPGREVVQLYLAPQSAPGGGATAGPQRPARVLAGFAVAQAQPGEEVVVTAPLAQRAAQVWDGGWRTLPGPYTVEASHSIEEPRLTTAIEV
ncbi:MAG: glycoside hydrolase family 3 C-terminal domain-containing protein [Micromonosporaceae bacterium]|nr:glycoside hydrolase family 3 C-terminal domain-containing protein [Micromonosporaceae bacterium]